MRPFLYGRDALFALRKCVINNNNYKLNSSICSTLKDLKIARKTVRGCRGGKNKPRPISTRITERNEKSILSRKKCNYQNLVQIDLQKQISTQAKVLASKLAVWNARSMMNKSVDVCDLIIRQKVDICAITEAWLKGNDKDHVVLADMDTTLQDFDFHQLPRVGKSGGGICVILRKGYGVQTTAFNFESFECLQLTISIGPGDCLNLFVIYRSGSSKCNNKYFSDFSSLLETIALSPGQLVICGDFNIHVNKPDDSDARKLLDLLQSAGLKQHVDFPTHVSNNTLDLLITRDLESCASNVAPVHGLPSDHTGIICDINIQRAKATKRVVNSRGINNINKEDFRRDLQDSLSEALVGETSVDSMTESYNSTLCSSLNEHAPETLREISLRPKAPWYTDSLRDLKRNKRHLERKWLKSQLTVDKEIFHEECKNYKQALNEAKIDYHCSQIAECDSRQLFRIVDKLSVYKPSKSLPSHVSKKDLANRFSKFFDEKIRNLRLSLDMSASAQSKLSVDIMRDCKSRFAKFDSVSSDDVRETIKRSTIKTCQLDPLPASLTKLCLEDVLPSMTSIVNASLQSGVFPDCLKQALVTPILKKASLDVDEFKNFRPVSNLPFLGKVIERVAIHQLQTYLNDNSLFAKNQSAYRHFHSTETALVRVNNDLLKAVDDHQEAVLVLLDLSAAFDTVDYNILLKRLDEEYGICGTALQWFSSYLQNRKQSVIIDNEISEPIILDWGVPQGSVTGPVLFLLYSGPIQDIIDAHGLSGMIYADDTQLYIMMKPSERSNVLARLEACIRDIKIWMAENRLMLNDNKSEVLHVTSRFTKRLHLNDINIGGSYVTPSTSVRDLGVILDDTLTMTSHVNNICRSASFAIRKIGKLRRYLDQNSAEKLVHAYVTSRLDSCNALLYGLPDKELAKLQRMQNTAARVITRTRKQDHITPVLHELHWLPVYQRIIYKILLLTFKSLSGIAPIYISELINRYEPRRTLRSSSQLLLQEQTFRTATYGKRSFAVCAPRLWNSLPLHIRSSTSIGQFKSQLKTHLFNRAYNNY